MRSILLALFVLISFYVHAQTNGDALPPMMWESSSSRDHTATTPDGEKFTIAKDDRQSGTIIGYRVNDVGHKLYAILDYTTKKKITPFQFDDIFGFYDSDLSIVKLGMQHGVINNKGKIVIPCLYEGIDQIETGGVTYYMVARNARCGVVNGKNEIVMPIEYEEISKERKEDTIYLKLTKNGKQGLMNFTSRKMIIPVQYDRIRLDGTDNILIENASLYSYLDFTKGKMLSGWYRRAQIIGDKLVIVEEKGKWGMIDWAGKKIIPLEYEKLEWQPGLSLTSMIAVKDGKYGIIHIDGKIGLPLQYDLAEIICRNRLKVSANNKKGVFSMAGKAIVPMEYDEIKEVVDTNFLVTKNYKYGVLNGAGNVVLPVEYDALTNVKKWGVSKAYWLLAYKNGKKGIVNAVTGKVDVSCTYDDLIGRYKSSSGVTQSFEHYLIAVKNGRYGLITTSDEVVLPFEFDELQYMDNRYLIAKKGGKYGVVDYKNTVALPFEYQFVTYRNSTIIAYKSGYEKFQVNYQGTQSTISKVAN